MQIVLTMQNQTETQKDALEAEWATLQSNGYVTITSAQQPDLTYTTSIVCDMATADKFNKYTLTGDKQPDDSWVSSLKVENTSGGSNTINPEDFTSVMIVI